MAFPSKRTPELEDKILGAVRRGHSLRKAAALHMVPESNVRRWRDNDPKFAARLEQAIAQREDAALAIIWKREPRWEAMMTLLERTNREEWGRRQFVEQTGADGGPVRIVLVDELAVKRAGT